MVGLLRSKEGPRPWVNRDGGVKCCFNGNEDCSREDVAVILLCVVFLQSQRSHYWHSLANFGGVGVTVKGLQLVSLCDQL